MIQSEFLHASQHYPCQTGQYEELWSEVAHAYTKSDRYYHTLSHLDHLLSELKPYQSQFHYWDTIVFAISYHDVIYNIYNSNNEIKSAELAEKRLRVISFPPDEIHFCKRLIQATQKHVAEEQEVNLFIDADLAILGADTEVYHRYAAQVRKEYSAYPDLIYNSGRIKVLTHFLERSRIFKTVEFNERYELAARHNLQMELQELS